MEETRQEVTVLKIVGQKADVEILLEPGDGWTFRATIPQGMTFREGQRVCLVTRRVGRHETRYELEPVFSADEVRNLLVNNNLLDETEATSFVRMIGPDLSAVLKEVLEKASDPEAAFRAFQFSRTNERSAQ